MKAAGCIGVGKTNTPEFALRAHNLNEVLGTTRNADHRARSAHACEQRAQDVSLRQPTEGTPS